MERARGRRRSGWRRVAAAAVAAVESFLADRGPQLAAAISYRAIFSVVPLLTFTVTVLGLVLRDEGRRGRVVSELVERFSFSEATRADLEEILSSIPSPWSVLGVVSVLAVVWSASGVMGSLRVGLAVAAGERGGRSFVTRKLLDVLLVLAVTVLGLAAAALNVVTRAVTQWSERVADALGAGALGALFNDAASGLVAPALLLVAACAFLYRVVSPVRPPWRPTLAAAAVAGIGLQAVQLAVSWYLAGPAELDAVYGSLGTALAFLLAVHASATVFLVGAELLFALAGREPPSDEGLLARVRRRLAGEAG